MTDTRRGTNLVPLWRPDEAAAELQQALRSRPDDARLHNNLASALLEEGREEEALRELAEAVRLDPAYSLARFNLGNGLIHAGRTQEGVGQLVELLRGRDPASAGLRLKAVAALAKLGPAARSAEPALLELERRDPGSAEAVREALGRIRGTGRR